MKKMLIAFDGHHFSQGAFDFVCRINEQEPVLVTGVFLPVVDYAELLYSFGGLTGPLYFQDVAYEDTGVVQKNIDHFKAMCIKNDIEFRVHPDMETHIISQLTAESRFADLLVVSSELFYKNLGESSQDDYIEDVLHKSECPVVLIPEHYVYPENIILAYDGSESSVYAIKQFTYLFPEMTKLKTTLAYFGSESIPDLSNIEELAARHFEDLNIYELDADARNYFNTWLADNGNSLLVTGAYGRSALSEMFRKSFINETIHDHKIPLFIAHR